MTTRKASGDAWPAVGVTPIRHRRKCPVCGKASAQDKHPFCSQRCADVDLNRWLSGRYVIAGRDDEGAGTGREDDDGA